jgi:hypothetical protein
MRDCMGPEGCQVPLAHKTYSLAWNSATEAFYGDGLDSRAIRQPSREFIHNANIVYEVGFLPLLPRAVWYRILPKARKFLKGREELRLLMQEWMEDRSNVEKAADNIKQFCDIFEKGKNECSMMTASSWMAMWVSRS